MIEGILLGSGFILVALGYGFKLDFMKFIAGIFLFLGGYYIAYNLTWFGAQQWVFSILCGFGLSIPLWIHSIYCMTQTKKQTRLAIIDAKRNAPYRPEGEEEDDEDIQIEKERRYYEKAWKPNRLGSKTKVVNKKVTNKHIWD